MGNNSSALVDCIQECDIQSLKTQLTAVTQREEQLTELEDAIHALLSMDIESSQQFQQLQIALEMLVQTNPQALTTTACNESKWTAIHRACVTGNLSFLPFIYQRYSQHIRYQRDAFGLFPIDLVPPELLSAPTDEKNPTLLNTANDRRLAALHLLRQAKAETQSRIIRAYMDKHNHSPFLASGNQADEMEANLVSSCNYFIAFESDHGHEVDAPVLRLRYRLPRAEETLNGYFQLVWRHANDPRSEEPQYDHHVVMRDEMYLDPMVTGGSSVLTRRLVEEEPVLVGCFPLEVSHIPDDAVCHVLFVASDKHMMKRQILLSTEGIRMQTSYRPNQDEQEEGEEEEEEEETGHVFYVAGEEFRHRSQALAGQSFDTIEDLQAFVHDLRQAKTTQQQEQQGVNQDPTTPDNQVEHDNQPKERTPL